MRIGVIGDIHGDARALHKALAILDARRIDLILCTGDLIGYGYSNDEVVRVVRERAIPTVRGNHERWALEQKRVIGLRGWQPANLDDATWDFIAALPTSLALDLAGVGIEIHHAAPGSDMELVIPYKPFPDSITRFFDRSPADLLLLGHSHFPMIERPDRGLIVNPGSVHGVPGHQTSYTFATIDLADLGVRIFDIRLGREIRRDPVYLDDEEF
jgi:predicted phosphodiesterase